MTRVWIDLANSPHPRLFEPVEKRLRELGAAVLVTVRDHAQTRELALRRWPEAEVLGTSSPSAMSVKPVALLRRAVELRRWARGRAIDVALSHNSYAQLLAAKSLRIPAVTGMDFEHQPANHIGFRCARAILVPTLFPVGLLRRQGAARHKLVRYQGLKEQLYLGRFSPDPQALEHAGIGGGKSGRFLVVARTAPAGASYHRGENPMLAEALRFLCRRDDVLCLVLARHPDQRAALADLRLPALHLPASAPDGLSLLWQADLFLGAGGTMTREAALLGTPTYSLFQGRSAAVDDWLENRGMLRRLSSVDELRLDHETRMVDSAALREASDRLVELFARSTLDCV